ncbi:nucleotide exchange factor GrpE [Candidatus Bipolaricaulota bacterium]|nr:nucleotide exchange factor GrpE [Candidatus Bipolaricaulota bacterium]
MSKKDKKLQYEDVKREEEQAANKEAQATPLAEQLAAKDEEIRSYVDRLQRLQAEFENYKKRVLREMSQIEERIVDREILDFIPLYDNLQRAFANYSDETDAAAFVAGVEKIFAQFDQILKAKGVTPIPAEGEKFDPMKHEALLSVESSEEKNTILEEFERGYERSGRVLRPCKVKVSKGQLDTEDKEE